MNSERPKNLLGTYIIFVAKNFVSFFMNIYVSHIEPNKLGIMGRQHICKSIANKKIDFTDNSIASMNIQENQ